MTEVDHYSSYANYTAGTSDQTVAYSYDSFNHLIGRLFDTDGSLGGGKVAQTIYAYDGDQVALQFDSSYTTSSSNGLGTGAVSPMTGANLSHRYLWNPQAVDHLFADEALSHTPPAEGQTGEGEDYDLTTPGNVLWALTDHENTIRDLATYNAGTDTTTVANHRIFDSYGNLESETNAAVECLFGYTGRLYDEATHLQNNLNRWYDSTTGRWLNEDPSGFNGGDANLYRYVGNNSLIYVDPSGLCRGTDWLDRYAKGFNKLFGSSWSNAAGNVIYGGLVGSGLMNNDTLANANAWECLAGTALVSTGLVLGGEALLGIGTGSALFNSAGYWAGAQWYSSAAWATSPWTWGGLLGGGVYSATGSVEQSVQAGLSVPMMFPDRAAGDLAGMVKSGKDLWAGASNAKAGQAINDFLRDESGALKIPKPGATQKQGATDVPTWAKGQAPSVGQSGKQFAKQLLDERYGSGNYGTGPTSEFNKIKKWGDRHFMDP
jgi:RHS repeat-associated protein